MKPVKITLLFVLLLVFLMPAILSLGIRYLPGREVPQTGRSVIVSRDRKLEFNLVNPKNNLMGIGVVVKNPRRSEANLTFQLWGERNNLLRESTVSGLTIPDGALVKFLFPPVNLSAQTGYQFMFTSNADEEQAMEIYLEQGRNIPVFLSYYKPGSRLALIGNIYSSWLKRLFGK